MFEVLRHTARMPQTQHKVHQQCVPEGSSDHAAGQRRESLVGSARPDLISQSFDILLGVRLVHAWFAYKAGSKQWLLAWVGIQAMDSGSRILRRDGGWHTCMERIMLALTFATSHEHRNRCRQLLLQARQVDLRAALLREDDCWGTKRRGGKDGHRNSGSRNASRQAKVLRLGMYRQALF